MSKRTSYSIVVVSFLLSMLCGCEPKFSLVVEPGEGYTTAVNTYTTIDVYASGDMDDPDFPYVTVESVEIENEMILSVTFEDGRSRILVFAENPGKTNVTIHTSLGSKTLEITAVESDALTRTVADETGLPQPSTWLEGGQEDIEFVWTSSGAKLAGGNLSFLESGDEELISISPAYIPQFYPDSNVATVQFNQVGTGIVRTIDREYETAFEIVDDSAIDAVVPVLLATGESLDDTTLKAGSGGYDWLRVVAYDADSLRIGGLFNQAQVATYNTPGCDFQFSFGDFALYRETPGECEVRIRVGTYEENITFTYN